MKLKVEWVKTKRGYPAWICRYGNIESQSTISATRCFRTQLRKLRSLGISTSHIEPTPKIVKRKVENND